MIFHENRLLADDSHDISHLIFFKNWKISQYLSSAAVAIGAFRVYKVSHVCPIFYNPSQHFFSQAMSIFPWVEPAKCHAQGHNTVPLMRFKLATSQYHNS